jgi:Na+/serine symporter
MGKKTETTKEFLTSKRVTPLGIITMLAGLFYFILMETKIFEDIPDVVKVAIYAGILAFGVITGIKPVQFKKFAESVKEIVKDRSMSAEMKVQKLLNLALPILSELGEAHELLNIEQFDKKEELDTE